MQNIIPDRIKVYLFEGRLTLLCCLLTVAVLPVYAYYLPPFMILWGVAWLIETRFKFNQISIQSRSGILFILFLTLYLWQITGLIFADSMNSGLERIIKRLSFLLFPMVLFAPSELIIKNLKRILRIFAIATIVYGLFCIGNAFWESLYFKEGRWLFNPHPQMFDYENYFFSDRLTAPVHPTYVAIYVAFAVIIALESFFEKKSKLVLKIFWLAGISFLLAFLYLISSRAGFLSAVLTIPLFIFFKLYKRLPKIITFSILILLPVLFLIIARQNTRINYFLENVTENDITEVFDNDIRVNIWKSAIGVIKNNLVFGVGTGDASNELKKEFMNRGYREGYYDNLNAHNQFLEILIENGMIGLIIFLLIFGYMFYISLTDRNLLLGMFIIMILIFFFFETILNRIGGITFFPLFSFLLIHYKRTV